MQVIKSENLTNYNNIICSSCKNPLLLGHFTYSGKAINTSYSRNEYYVCNHCKTKFILLHEYFDDEGHIIPKVFSNDPNDKTKNWQDLLSKEQREKISKHLSKCKKCQEALENETLADAWFSSILHHKKNQ
jgi:hypothetical protein